jgi:antitoxin HicB
MAAKVALYQAMRAQHVGKAELARRLHWHLPQVDRLLDVRHASRIDQLEAGLGAVGKRLTLTIEDAPGTSARTRVARRGRARTRKAG